MANLHKVLLHGVLCVLKNPNLSFKCSIPCCSPVESGILVFGAAEMLRIYHSIASEAGDVFECVGDAISRRGRVKIDWVREQLMVCSGLFQYKLCDTIVLPAFFIPIHTRHTPGQLLLFIPLYRPSTMSWVEDEKALDDAVDGLIDKIFVKDSDAFLKSESGGVEVSGQLEPLYGVLIYISRQRAACLHSNSHPGLYNERPDLSHHR